jgi:hypothetical protein
MSHGDKSSMNTTLRPINHLRIFMIVLLVLSAAQFSCNLPLRQAKPLVTLPDLAISSVSLKMIGQSNTGCVDALKPYEVEVVIINQGKAPATGVVVECAPGIHATIAAIEPGKTEAVRFQANAEDGKYTVQVDPQNLVLESSESNNSYFYLAPTPTPPALCPTQPASTPGKNMLPVGLIYIDMNRAESWMVGSDKQLVKLFDGINLRISPDGSQAIYEADGDLWIANLNDQTPRNLIHTPDKIENNAQWWPANGDIIVYELMLSSPGIQANSGVLSIINMDGSGNEQIGGGPSSSLPALSSDGKTIAYEILGNPMLYEVGVGSHPFDALSFGLNPSKPPEFYSPAWSPDGKVLLWWMVENPSGENKVYSLLRFNLHEKSYTALYITRQAVTTQGWLPSPVWSPNGKWLAIQTRGETTPWDLIISRDDGSQWQRFGFASDPVWSPDGQRLVFIQWPSNADSYFAAKIFMVDVYSCSTVSLGLPEGCIPTQWISK